MPPRTSKKARPSPASDGEGRTSAKFYTLSVSATEKQLGSDAGTGLSPKEAERRLGRQNAHSLFAERRPAFLLCLKATLLEPVLWLMLVVCVVSLFFDRVALGLSSAVLALLHAGICAFVKYRAQLFDGEMQTYDIPYTVVIRNRRLLRVRGDCLVRGDVILLRKGDIVPADARLLTTHRLVVSEQTLAGRPEDRRHLLLHKTASVTLAPEDDPVRHSPENMVYAGSVIKQGRGKAMITATGGRTHLSGLVGSVPPSHKQKPPVFLTRAKKYISLINLIMAVAVIPLTVIGIFTLGDRYELLDMFLTALALSVLTLTEHLMALGISLCTTVRRAASEDPDLQNSADIRTSDTLERLGRMTHLVLVGTSALHDGRPTPEGLVTCGKTYACGHSEPDAAVLDMAGKLFLLREGLSDHLSCGELVAEPGGTLAHLDETVELICKWADPDPDSLMLRLERLGADGDGVEIAFPNEPPVYMYLTEDASVIDTCDTARDTEGEISMTGEALEFWETTLKKSYRQGKRVQILISECNGVRCAEGMMIMSVGLCRKTKGCIRSMEAAGISVMACLCDSSAENLCALTAAGLTEKGSVHRVDPRDTTPLLAYAEQGVRAFEGCSTKDILDYVYDLQKKGACVGVLSVERADLPLLEAADIAFTCAPADLRDALHSGMPEMGGAVAACADGTPDSDCASDLSRCMADVVIRRCDARGGGVCGLRRALLAAGQAERGVRMTLRFILLSQILRILMVFLPMLCGLTVLPAPALLVSGLAMDLLAVFCYTRCDLSSEPFETADRTNPRPTKGNRRMSIAERLIYPHRLFRNQIILTAASVILPWTVALVAKMLNTDFGADPAYFGMLSLFSTQVTILATGHLPRYRRVGFFVMVAAVCIYMGALAVSLGAGLGILWSLLLPLLQPLLWLAAYGFLRLAKKDVENRE